MITLGRFAAFFCLLGLTCFAVIGIDALIPVVERAFDKGNWEDVVGGFGFASLCLGVIAGMAWMDS